MLSPGQLHRLKAIATPWPALKPDFKPEPSAWFGSNHARVFTELLTKKPAGLYMELGTWTGAGSTNFVAKFFPRMTMVCVDTFEGSEEHLKHPTQSKIAANLWSLFCVNRWEERSRIFPVRKSSVSGMQLIANANLAPDFIYIDAAHDAASVHADVQAALTLFPKAVVFGDDYVLPGKGHTGVYDGLMRAKDQNLFQISEISSFDRIWYLTRNLK
jgi:predicted O-methyltransferase YrrM